jgi:hypothetical protein
LLSALCTSQRPLHLTLEPPQASQWPAMSEVAFQRPPMLTLYWYGYLAELDIQYAAVLGTPMEVTR